LVAVFLGSNPAVVVALEWDADERGERVCELLGKRLGILLGKAVLATVDCCCYSEKRPITLLKRDELTLNRFGIELTR
jgi:hypothetical protein